MADQETTKAPLTLEDIRIGLRQLNLSSEEVPTSSGRTRNTALKQQLRSSPPLEGPEHNESVSASERSASRSTRAAQLDNLSHVQQLLQDHSKVSSAYHGSTQVSESEAAKPLRTRFGAAPRESRRSGDAQPDSYSSERGGQEYLPKSGIWSSEKPNERLYIGDCSDKSGTSPTSSEGRNQDPSVDMESWDDKQSSELARDSRTEDWQYNAVENRFVPGSLGCSHISVGRYGGDPKAFAVRGNFSSQRASPSRNHQSDSKRQRGGSATQVHPQNESVGTANITETHTFLHEPPQPQAVERRSSREPRSHGEDGVSVTDGGRHRAQSYSVKSTGSYRGDESNSQRLTSDYSEDPVARLALLCWEILELAKLCEAKRASAAAECAEKVPAVRQLENLYDSVRDREVMFLERMMEQKNKFGLREIKYTNLQKRAVQHLSEAQFALDRLTVELRSLTIQIEEVQEELSRTKTSLAAQVEKIEALKDKSRNMPSEKEVTDLNLKLRSSQNKAAQLLTDHATLKLRHDELTAAVLKKVSTSVIHSHEKSSDAALHDLDNLATARDHVTEHQPSTLLRGTDDSPQAVEIARLEKSIEETTRMLHHEGRRFRREVHEMRNRKEQYRKYYDLLKQMSENDRIAAANSESPDKMNLSVN